MAQNFFPISFKTHVIFVIFGVLFYLLQFYRLRHSYQPIMAAAIAATMLIYINDTFFYATGYIELFLIVIVFFLLAKLRIREAKELKLEEKKRKQEQEQNTEGSTAN